MSNYADTIKALESTCGQTAGWSDISPEHAARMRLQNRFQTGLDIARYTAAIMRKDMGDYDKDPGQYTQSLGCWHGLLDSKNSSRLRSTLVIPISATFTCRVG